MNGINPLCFVALTRVEFLKHGSHAEQTMLTATPLQESDVPLFTLEQVKQILKLNAAIFQD